MCIFAEKLRNMEKYHYSPSYIERVNIFVASCIETTAKKLGVEENAMYARMQSINLIEGYIIPCYEVLHTESRENVTADILQTLEIWENKKGKNHD